MRVCWQRDDCPVAAPTIFNDLYFVLIDNVDGKHLTRIHRQETQPGALRNSFYTLSFSQFRRMSFGRLFTQFRRLRSKMTLRLDVPRMVLQAATPPTQNDDACL
jgi:hypothetical protein